MSRTFFTNSGSVESLEVATRCGCSENAFEMRCTIDGASPAALAMLRELQCVRPAGSVSSVAVTTSATFSSVAVRGAPGRGSSVRPSSRRSANRRCQVTTVMRAIPSRSVMARLLSSSAANSTISARSASPRVILRRRRRASNSARSPSDNSIRTAFGATMTAIPAAPRSESQLITTGWIFRGRDTHLSAAFLCSGSFSLSALRAGSERKQLRARGRSAPARP